MRVTIQALETAAEWLFCNEGRDGEREDCHAVAHSLLREAARRRDARVRRTLKRGGYPVQGSNRVPIVVHKVAGQPILPPPTDEDVERIRKMLDNRYGKENS